MSCRDLWHYATGSKRSKEPSVAAVRESKRPEAIAALRDFDQVPPQRQSSRPSASELLGPKACLPSIRPRGGSFVLVTSMLRGGPLTLR